MKRDPAPDPAIVPVIAAGIMQTAREAAARAGGPATAQAEVRAALVPLWPDVPPEAVRDVLVAAAELAWDRGARSLPDELADQTAGWLLELTGEARAGTLASPGPGGFSPPLALASSVAFDRAEDAETFASLAALLALAFGGGEGL